MRECVVCGKVIARKAPHNKVCCSPRCSAERRKANYTRWYEGHKEALGRKRREISARHRPPPRPCVVCGRHFQPAAASHCLCSAPCRAERKRLVAAALYRKKNPNPKPVGRPRTRGLPRGEKS